MKALAIEKFGGTEELHLEELPTPEPKSHEVQIAIAYASVNPVDWKIISGSLQHLFPYEFPLIPGWDASGTVTAIGKECTTFAVGDDVFCHCRNPVAKWGTYAEYVCADESYVAKKPEALSFAEAAAIPLVGLTAWQALVERAKLKKGESILIHAGAGGVGSLAIPLAKAVGATVYTTASKNHHPYVKSLGADGVIDYTTEDVVKKIREMEPGGVDVVLDCAGYEALEKSFDVVKKGGRIVSIVNKADPRRCQEKDIDFSFMLLRPDGAQLETIAKWLVEGKIPRPHVTEMPFSDYKKALNMSQEGHTKGKIVLKIRQ